MSRSQTAAIADDDQAVVEPWPGPDSRSRHRHRGQDGRQRQQRQRAGAARSGRAGPAARSASCRSWCSMRLTPSGRCGRPARPQTTAYAGQDQQARQSAGQWPGDRRLHGPDAGPERGVVADRPQQAGGIWACGQPQPGEEHQREEERPADSAFATLRGRATAAMTRPRCRAVASADQQQRQDEPAAAGGAPARPKRRHRDHQQDDVDTSPPRPGRSRAWAPQQPGRGHRGGGQPAQDALLPVGGERPAAG